MLRVGMKQKYKKERVGRKGKKGSNEKGMKLHFGALFSCHVLVPRFGATRWYETKVKRKRDWEIRKKKGRMEGTGMKLHFGALFSCHVLVPRFRATLLCHDSVLRADIIARNSCWGFGWYISKKKVIPNGICYP